MSLSRFEKASVGLSLLSLFIATCGMVIATVQTIFASDSVQTSQRINLQGRQISACQDVLVNFEIFFDQFEREKCYSEKRETIVSFHKEHGKQTDTSITAFGHGIDIEVVDIDRLMSSATDDRYMIKRLQELYEGGLGQSARNAVGALIVLGIYSGNEQRAGLKKIRQTFFGLFNTAATQFSLPPNSDSEYIPGADSPDELLEMMKAEIDSILQSCRGVMLGQKMELF